jgi:Oxygen-sensitive ribonucleoside-triphosphate reductase
MTYLKEIKTERPYTLSGSETTDLALFVRTSSEDVSSWNRQKIVDALVRETYIDVDTADKISADVEEMIINSKIKVITAPLIRELVNAKLIERGLEQPRMMHTRIGLPIYDVDQLILHPNKENANVPHGPEATNLTLAEGIKKEYALLSVFSQDIADAHLRGDLHLHDLGFIDRPYCSGQSLEYIKKVWLKPPQFPLQRQTRQTS